MRPDILTRIEGYDRIVRERELCRKYGTDFSVERGAVEEYVRRLHPERLCLTVADVIAETPSAKTFRLVSPDGPLPPFQAGQYISVSCDIGGVRTGRPYSLSSPPGHRGYYDITVKAVEDGFVSTFLLNSIRRGDALETSGPAGHFHHHPILHDRELVLLAGGSGITPFLSMIREALEGGLDRTFWLFHGDRTTGEAIFREELLRLAARFPNLRYIPVIENPGPGCSDACGYITANLIRREVGDTAGKTFFLCGPGEMYRFCIPELLSLEVPAGKIRREVFGPPRSISRAPGWPGGVREKDVFAVAVRAAGGAVTRIPAAAGEPLLAALERSGIVVPSLCRSGECSRCRLKLLSGRVYQPEGVLVRRSDRQHGYIHSCAAYPLEDLEILL